MSIDRKHNFLSQSEELEELEDLAELSIFPRKTRTLHAQFPVDLVF